MSRKFFSLFAGALLVFLCSTRNVSAQNINISFVGQHEPNTSSSIYYGDVWAENNLACLGIWQGYGSSYGVGIYDISNPSSPALQSIYTAASSSANQFEQGVIRDRIGYFASWSGGGLHIVSLTNAASPLRLSQIGSGGSGFDDIHTLFLERNFVYEASHRSTSTGPLVKVIDVSNPFAPVFVRNITTTNTIRVHQITAVKKGASTILYTSGWGDGSANTPGQTDIWDVSNVGTQPARWLGKIISGSSSHSSWPTADGNTLVVCRETSGGDVRFYDISNPAVPVLQTIISPSRMGLVSAIPHNPVVISNLLFLSWYQHGIQIYNITDRLKPVRIGSYDTYPGSVSASFQGNWGVFPDLGLNKLLLSDIQTGFYVLDASAVLTGTNNYPPLLITNPVSATVTQGGSATFSALFTGSSLKYQWRLNNTNVSAATNALLILSNVQPAQAGNYLVVASNAFGIVTSSSAALSVVTPTNLVPTISSQPQNVSVYQDEEASFSVAVTGAAPFTFQWRFNGTEIPGATNNVFTRPAVQPEEVGAYSVVVSNGYGSTTSSNAFLSLIDSPYINGVQSFPGLRNALISWKTTVPANGQVQYDPSSAPGQIQMASASATASFSLSSYIDRTISTNHTILLTGLEPGTRYNFQVISTASGSNYLSGVYSFTTAGGPIILDNIHTNGPVSFTGTWSTNSSSGDKYGSDYRFATSTSGSPNATATYRPTIPVPGRYDVFTWYPQGSNRTTNSPFTISAGGSLQNVAVNQQINGGKWWPLGRLQFSAGTNDIVRIWNNALPSGNVVMADAVQFSYVESQDFPLDGSVPFWWSNFYFGGSTNPSADPDGDGYTTGQEYILGTSPLAADHYFSVKVFRSGAVANIFFSPCLGNRNYTLLQSTNLSSPTWQPVSTGSILTTASGEGVIGLAVTNDVRGFYRIAVQLTTNGAVSGSFATPVERSFSPYATDAICGPNRAYVK